MTLKVNPVLAILIIVGALVLIFALFRGCSNSKKDQIAITNYKEQIKKHQQDSILQANEKAAYNDTLNFMDGQLSLSNNKILALNEDLENANDRITKLINKHVPVQPSSDTSITTVSNEFVNDCSDCFTELKNGQQLVLKYKAEKDIQEQILQGKINVKDIRISSLERVMNALNQSNSALLGNIKDLQDKWMPRGRLYLSGGALWSPMPIGVGAGLLYQNKRNLMWGAKYYYTKYGNQVETTISIPLSLRFK